MLESAANRFAMSVAAGHHCAAVTADESWLPRALVLAADRRLTLPLLTGEDVGVVASRMFGRKSLRDSVLG